MSDITYKVGLCKRLKRFPLAPGKISRYPQVNPRELHMTLAHNANGKWCEFSRPVRH